MLAAGGWEQGPKVKEREEKMRRCDWGPWPHHTYCANQQPALSPSRVVSACYAAKDQGPCNLTAILPAPTRGQSSQISTFVSGQTNTLYTMRQGFDFYIITDMGNAGEKLFATTRRRRWPGLQHRQMFCCVKRFVPAVAPLACMCWRTLHL